MKFIALILLTSFSISFAFSESRVDKHEKAVQLLEETHFFKDGKGMILPPNFIKIVDGTQYVRQFNRGRAIRNRFGLIKLSKDKYRGLFNVNYKEREIGVLGCVFCHAGRAAGIDVPGLGNKNVDVYQIGKDLSRIYRTIAPFYRVLTRDAEMEAIFNNSNAFAKVLSNSQFSNKTAGLVPISMIRYWFYDYAYGEVPSDLTSGAVKVPQFWGYTEKKKVGQFCDGGGNGNLPGWGAAVELAAGQDYNALRDSEYIHKLELVEEVIGDILSPKYPFKINQEMAARGKRLFESKCMKCHGEYKKDENDLPIILAPKHIPIEIVKTDSDRLAGNTDTFYKLVEDNPIVDILQANYFKPGYFAPRLEGIWSRFPYLHNGSVPTLFDLLSHPRKRIDVFSLEDAGERYRFDEKNLGLTTVRKGSREYRKLKKSIKRTVYKTSVHGQSNKGHYNFGHLKKQEKYELIEYLKTL